MQTVDCLLCNSRNRLDLLTLRPDAHRRVHPRTAEEQVRFVVCRECGFVYQTPRFTIEELSQIYQEEYRKDTVEADGVPKQQYLEFTRNKSDAEFRWINEHIAGGHGKRVLEIGCATGQLLRNFKDRGWEPLGVEPTRSFAEYGARVHGFPILPVLFEQARLEPGFDLVILSQVLEHVYEPDMVLKRVASLLGPNGRIYISVPYYETYLKERPARELFISTHLYAFSPVTLTNLAARCGLIVEASGTMGRYLSAILLPHGSMPQQQKENPRAIRRRVKWLAWQYFVLYDSRFLAAEGIKRRLSWLLGEAKGESAIATVRRLKRKLFGAVHYL